MIITSMYIHIYIIYVSIELGKSTLGKGAINIIYKLDGKSAIGKSAIYMYIYLRWQK